MYKKYSKSTERHVTGRLSCIYFRHFTKVNQDIQNYHRMYIVSQERYEKLANLQSSGGAQSIKDEGDTVVQDLVSNNTTRNISTTSSGPETESECNVEGGACLECKYISLFLCTSYELNIHSLQCT